MKMFKAFQVLGRSRLFRRTHSAERTWDVIAWWESRRVPYNLIVGTTGLVSAIIVLLSGFLAEHFVGDAIGAGSSPLFEVFAIVIYGIMANICYTGGWILELLSRRIWRARAEAFGEIAFTWGTLCSVLLTLVPAALAVVIGACSIITHGWKK
jgi:hypothetical protein